MSNLPESSTFDAGVYQLELTDPVIGGPSGISNTPLKNLANRTKYLKDHVDAVETAIGLLAPKADPSFTGNPTAPTPPQFDNDLSIANTAFVKASGKRLATISQYVASVTLTASLAGRLINLAGAGGFTVTLPAANGMLIGDSIIIGNFASSSCTIQVAGSNVIYPWGNGSITSFALRSGESVTLVSDGNNAWYPIDGTGTLSFSSGFTAALSTNGYQKLPSGLIIQWGSVISSAANTGQTLTYPIAFPNGGLWLGAVLSNGLPSVNTAIVQAYPNNATSGVISCNGAGIGMRWIAIGY